MCKHLKILKHISKETKMIVGVSILGNPAKLDYIEKICKKNNIYFLNDNCDPHKKQNASKKIKL